MGLRSKPKGAKDSGGEVSGVVALAGNPNVGKSTVFNALTGLRQHTGNWPGKTVENAKGEFIFNGRKYMLVDIPGTYSLKANSAEEEAARDFICFGGADAVIVVCDSTCLERNLGLVLQITEITPNVVVCVNLLDEAEKKEIQIDFSSLEESLGVPVAGISARNKRGLDILLQKTEEVVLKRGERKTLPVLYPPAMEKAINFLTLMIIPKTGERISARWAAIKLLENDREAIKKINGFLGFELDDEDTMDSVQVAKKFLQENGVEEKDFSDIIAKSIVEAAEKISGKAVKFKKGDCFERDRRLDRIFTNRIFGIPIMLLLLAFVFWITISGANYVSEFLSKVLFSFGDFLDGCFKSLNAPEWLDGILVHGIYRVLAWVVSVMLPPMAIFFPLFTLLEDSGYLPRVAFNLDKYFKRACACGKQSLTMAMGFGCNAVGVTGCRIIDSPRERLIAVLTNNFMPCNGRFPTIIAMISMFFAGMSASLSSSALSALMLTGVIFIGAAATFLVSKILSKTVLKGVPSSFTLELPPYRRPQVGKVIIRSVLDRTVFVLGRAVMSAAPAGAAIWLLANVSVDGRSLLSFCSEFLEPAGRLIGLDGVILLAFILGFPANEIVVPIMIMAYMSKGEILELSGLFELKELLVSNGWNVWTAVCAILFSLFHWPCATTMLTIKKETGSAKWTFLAALIPTAAGVLICALIAVIAKIFA